MANQFLSQISLGTQAVLIYTGNGSPEGVETAPVGSVYLNATASNAANILYVKGSGTGNTGWSLLAASTIPAGSDTEIQFNDAGVSAGDPQLTWNKTSNILTVGSTNNAGTILVKDQGEIRFEEDNPNGTNYVSLKAPSAITSSINLTLPGELPGGNSGFLVGNSSGALGFTTTSRLLYNETTGGIFLANGGNNPNFFLVQDSLSNDIFSIGYETFFGGTIPRFYSDFIMNNSTRIFAEDLDGDPTEIFTLYGDDFYFGPYDKDGGLTTGINVYIRYGRGNAGADSAITISGINYYIDIPLAINANPPQQSGATNPNLLSISGANANHLTTVAGDVNDIRFNLSRNVQFTTGSTISAIRAFYINPPTYTATAATQTITHASTVSISGAPVKSTNVGITNTSALRIEAGAVSTATNSYSLYVDPQTGATNNYTAVFASGFVGVGTTDPTGTLNVVSSSSSSTNQFLVENHSTNNTPAAISYVKSRGTKASPTSVNTLDYLGVFLFRAADSVNTLRQVGTFGVRANGTIGNNSVPSEMFFGVSPGYNSTDPFGDSTIQLLLSADTTVAINSTTKGTGQFNVFNGSSSRVATIIRGTTSQSSDLLQLQTVTPTTVFSVSANGDTTIAPIARTSGTPTLLTVTGPTHTTLGGEATDINFNLARTVQFSTGALTTQRAVRIQAPTYAFVASSTLSNAVTLGISGPPVKGTNASITNAYALRIEGGAVSTATNAYGLYVDVPTGATNNYGGYISGRVGFGATPTATVHATSASASTVTGRFEGTTSQSVNIFEVATKTATVASVSSIGNVTFTQEAQITGSPTIFTITGAANTSQTASTEATDINFNLARNVQFATGALTTQRAVRIQAPTYAFVGSSTLTHASTLSISGAPVKGTNATITSSSALRIEAGAVSTVTTAYGIYVQSPTGATTNYALYIGGKTQIVPDVHTSGSPVGILYTGAAHTTLTASTESPDLYLNLARTVQFAAGALTTQRAIRIAAPTYAFVSASTISDASTVAISGNPVAGTNATITRSYALSIESGSIALRDQGSLHMFESIGLGTNKIIFRAASDLSSDSTYTWPVLPAGTPVGAGHYVLTGDSGSLAWTALTNAQLGTQIYNEVPSGTVNGSNALFSTANGIEAGTLRVYKNGLRQKPGSGYDYTLSGQEITFESGNIPQTGDVILVDYVTDGMFA